MTVQELTARFPEIPHDLHGEALLERFAEAFGTVLRIARSPAPCSTRHDAANHYYLKLIGPLAIYGYGLVRREQVLAELQQQLDLHAADPDGFLLSLVPTDAALDEPRGPGCG